MTIFSAKIVTKILGIGQKYENFNLTNCILDEYFLRENCYLKSYQKIRQILKWIPDQFFFIFFRKKSN